VPAELAYPLSYLLRTEVGQGPLEMLMLRGFVLPSRIFVGGEQPQIMAPATAGPRK
jgi:type VI secretion system protein ImpL